ncbi:SPOR domain-containing protein [Marinobacter sp.]|uniref:SPOR domain-containing protein n=1 Tax=Marinobacter sp. TaxID=50741 RepID=UPI003561BF62
MSGLKQRIIGALVLISLAVIFVPMMFDEPHDERAVRSLDIPEEPPFPEVTAPDDRERLDGVPDYRVEEVEPPTPDVVEDPAMGQEPPVASEDPAVPAEDEVPLVGEEESASASASDEQQSQQQARTPEETGTDRESTESEETVAGSAETASGSASDESADFERTLEGAWVLQLGSFGSEENARRLRDGVRERGYGAHLQEVTRGDQRLIRVFSGPFAEKAEAEKAKTVLDEAFGVQALVTKGKG